MEKSNENNWIIIDDCEQFIAKCSVCGHIADSRELPKYCPDCEKRKLIKC